MKLIIGLGNIGTEYENTRHNLGFLVIDKLLKELDLKLDNSKFNGQFTSFGVGEDKIIIGKPSTYMNNSGLFVSLVANYFKITPDNILIIYDDKDLSFLSYKIKQKGSSAGHNGLKSIIDSLGTSEFNRLRCGIGYNQKYRIVDYVLQPWTKKEMKVLDEYVDNLSIISRDFITHTSEEIANKYNTKND